MFLFTTNEHTSLTIGLVAKHLQYERSSRTKHTLAVTQSHSIHKPKFLKITDNWSPGNRMVFHTADGFESASDIGLGCMGITAFYGAPMPQDDATTLLKACFEAGYVELWKTQKSPSERASCLELVLRVWKMDFVHDACH